MPRLAGAALAVVVGAVPVAAQAEGRFVKGPYLQNVAPTAITVMWETSIPAPARLRVRGPGGERTVDVAAAARQEVEIDGLEPATRYRYVIETAGASTAGELITAPVTGAALPMTFIVFGDTRSNAEGHRRVVDRVRAEVPDFVLGTGDLVDEGGREDQWQQFFEVERDLLRDNVLFPTIGNHDRQGRGRTADNFRSYFAVPENSPDPERYYAFTYGQSRFLVLDSNAYSFALTDQTAWIERELQAARQDARIRHVFVAMHHPPFSVSLHGGQRDLRERWTPLFERYQVAAVFSGHDHVYTRAEQNGVRYFVSGGGGSALYPRAPRPSAADQAAVRYFERVHHYLRVHVYGDLVEITAVRADGTPIETVAWGAPPRIEAPRPPAIASPAVVPTVGGASRDTSGLGAWGGRLAAALVLGAIFVLWRALRG